MYWAGVDASSSYMNRKHLYLDLQPYTCFYANCSFNSLPFADRQLWSNHLELDHRFGPTWESITCPLCLEATEPGKSHTLIHFARHMEDIALAALPREVDSDAESDGDINGGSAHDLKSEDNMSEASLQSGVFCELTRQENGSLNSLGTFRCDLELDSSSGDRIIAFTAKNDATEPLFSINATRMARFRKEGATSISCNRRDVIMQFSLQCDCDKVWQFLDAVQRVGPSESLEHISESCEHERLFGGLCVDCGWDVAENLGQQAQSPPTYGSHEAVETYAALDSYWSMEEQRSFRDYIRQYGTNWTTIAQKMGTKTSDMVRAQYFRDVESGDTELEQMAEHASIYNAHSAYAADSEAFRRPLPDPPQRLLDQQNHVHKDDEASLHHVLGIEWRLMI